MSLNHTWQLNLLDANGYKEQDFSSNAQSARSPLRYPGGKTRAVAFLSEYVPNNLSVLLSPFFGGGSFELFISTKGVKVLGYDVFLPLVEFWQCLLLNANTLADEVEKHYPLSKAKFYELQQTTADTPLRRAAIYYVLNRASFSGATLSGVCHQVIHASQKALSHDLGNF